MIPIERFLDSPLSVLGRLLRGPLLVHRGLYLLESILLHLKRGVGRW